MARVARHQLNETCLRPGTLYHVTNRGAGRRDIFFAPVDRLVFLAALADACRRYGLLVHAYCLMGNHIHLLVEDARGCLSQALSLTQSVYARYFNDSRGQRGAGHVFGDRFFCEVVSTAGYYDRLASYILLNPMRCTTPLALSPEGYEWSSAALLCGSLTSATFFARLVDQHGGTDAILTAMPKPSTPEVARNRRARFDALLSGEWISADAVRCGRSRNQMRDVLARRAGMPRPQPDTDHGDRPDDLIDRPLADSLPRAAVAFAGAALTTAFEILRDECASGIPGGEPARARVVAYLLWRFCSASSDTIAAALGRGVSEVIGMVESVRRLRTTMAAWEAALWRLEWRLRWRLASGPHRT
jgi:REP element-mobilizing transposase RayT